jgi:hypothetical protein
MPVGWKRVAGYSICKNEGCMLNQDQIILCGMMMFSAEQCEETLSEAFPGQSERQEHAMRALHLYDAYLGVVDAALEDSFDPMTMVSFKGFLAVELEMPKPDRIITVWTVSDLLAVYGLIEERDIQFAISQDEAFERSAYLAKRPIQARIAYYNSWYAISDGHGIYVDLSVLEPLLSDASKEFLRSQLRDYLATKDEFGAQMDVQLIIGILQGYMAKWPSRELSGDSLSQVETTSLIAKITEESNFQLAYTDFSTKHALKNLAYLNNVIYGFFIRSGIFASLDQP